MAVAMMVDNPGGTQEIYDRVRDRLGMETPRRHLPRRRAEPEWRLAGDRGLGVRGDAKRFVKERMLPAFEALGALPLPPPHFWPVHNHTAWPPPHTDLEDSRVAVGYRLAGERLSREIAGLGVR